MQQLKYLLLVWRLCLMTSFTITSMSFSLSMAFWLACPRDTYEVRIILEESRSGDQKKGLFVYSKAACSHWTSLHVCSCKLSFSFFSFYLFFVAYSHLSEYERQGEGLRGQVPQRALCWAWEAVHTHSCHIKYSFSISKWTTGGPIGRKRKKHF